MTETPILHGLGTNIATHRRAAGVTQADLAARIGRSVQWVSAVEQGRRHADRLTDLLRIAAVLDCTIDDLIGRPVDSMAPGARGRGESVEAVRTVLLRTAVPTASDRPALPLPDLDARIAQAWATWHQSPTAHTLLGGVLPDLVADSVAAYQGAQDKRAAARTLAGAYHVTRQWLHHIPDGELAWIAADRAMHAARESEDPRLIALGGWALSASYRRAGQPDEATRLCLAAADELKPRIDESHPQPELLAAFGMLHLAAAISAAQSDEDGRAWVMHRIARDAAAALGDHHDPWTIFGRGNVDIHELALQAELGRPDAVVEYSHRLNVDDVPSVERRSRVLIDTARGFVQRGEDEAAILVLLDAERESADEVRHSTLVTDLVRELIHRDRARARSHVHALARRIGVLAS